MALSRAGGYTVSDPVQFPYEVLAYSRKEKISRTIEEKSQFTNRRFKVFHRLKLWHFVWLQVQRKCQKVEETLCIRDSRKTKKTQKSIGMGCNCGTQHSNSVKTNKKLNKITNNKILMCSQFSYLHNRAVLHRLYEINVIH